MTNLNDALKSMTRRQLEELRSTIDKELCACSLCGSEGARVYSIRGGDKSRASMMFCKPCFEKHRLPEGRANATSV